jgi:hypothetical protein
LDVRNRRIQGAGVTTRQRLLEFAKVVALFVVIFVLPAIGGAITNN